MKNIEQELTDYIVEKYNPIAVLLHGSRASGNAREHSDWDFAIFVTEKITANREIIKSQNIEIRVLVLPIPDKIDNQWLVLRQGNVKVLYDPQNKTLDVIKKVTGFYSEPLDFSEGEFYGHGAWFRSQLDSMIDYQNEQEAFFRKLSELYPRVIMYWFHFIKHTYMPQVYYSLPILQTEDLHYFNYLKILAGNFSNEEKIVAAENIYKRIWKQ
jgi:predicted nucleotidyltransferase